MKNFIPHAISAVISVPNNTFQCDVIMTSAATVCAIAPKLRLADDGNIVIDFAKCTADEVRRVMAMLHAMVVKLEINISKIDIKFDVRAGALA